MKIPKNQHMAIELQICNDAEQWDGFVSVSPYGHFMQSYAWGEFQAKLGWEAHYLLDTNEAVPGGAVLLLARKMPLVGGRITYAPRGPVCDFADNARISLFADALRVKLNEIGGAIFRCDPYVAAGSADGKGMSAGGFSEVKRDWSFWNAPKLVFWLDLGPDEDSLMRNAGSTCRNEIRAGYRKGVIYERGTRDDLEDFYRLMVSTGQHKGIAVHGVDYYRTLYDTLNRSATVELFLGRYEGMIIAAGMSVIYGAKAWLLYAASDREYYKLKANRTLQWEMILWAKRRGCLRYDFRGTATSDPPGADDPGYGVYEFKKSFGPEYTRLIGYYDMAPSPWRHQLFRLGEEKALPLAYRAKTWLSERRGRR